MQRLSAYILTKNSEKYLAEVLFQVSKVADDIVIVDSGSTDNTALIANRYSNTRFIQRPFDNFVLQRNFAAEQCLHDWILFVDSDEILNDKAVIAINLLKKNGFTKEAYAVRREWVVLGTPVRSMLPIVSPDYPVRLFNKTITSFKESSNIVHETPTGYASKGFIEGALTHYTFETREELARKLQFYTDLAALDLVHNRRTINYFKYWCSPFASFFRFYFIKKGIFDGLVGIILAKYAYDYVRLKYKKALQLKQQ